MKRIRILWVGRTRERYLAEGISHYLKLLNRMAHISVVEIKDERGKDPQSALAREGERVLRQVSPSFVLLDERGAGLTSQEFADFLRGRDTVDFVLGGPYGVSDEVRMRAGATVALSPMTFPHEMARLILLEQIFRAETILKGREYHH